MSDSYPQAGWVSLLRNAWVTLAGIHTQLSDMLPRAQFRRVHRSFLVNVEHISRLDKQSLQLSQQVIPIGEQFRINLGEFWAKLFRKD